MQTVKWEAVTFDLQAMGCYENPYMDVSAEVVFNNEQGETFTVPCFWDGDATWRARFAPPSAGVWTWKSRCSNLQDSGLHGLSGSFMVAAGETVNALEPVNENETGNALETHGFLKVSDNGRGFVHADGTPFFWLGDTVWSCPSRAIQESSTTGAPLTAHLNGGLATPEKLNDAEWLNFHMYQSSHHLESHLTAKRYSAEDRALRPIRPVLNGEPAYENIGCYGREGTLSRELVRKVSWYSVLSGGNAGIAYGGHGLWSWHREGEVFAPAPFWHMPEDWKQAADFPGSDDFARLKRFMEDFAWWQLEPCESPFEQNESDKTPICATDGKVLIAYLESANPLRIPTGRRVVRKAIWFDPSDRRWVECEQMEQEEGFVLMKAPFPMDVLLVMEWA